MTERRVIRASDGRILEVQLAGPENGRVLLFHDGTPGAGLPSPAFIAAAAERGLRYVCAARPGYASSTRRPGRSVADVAEDAAAVLDALGVDRCYTLGWSGGGPHTLACAALLPERVIAAATVGSVAPYGAQGLDFVAGMGRENIEEFNACLEGSAVLASFLERWLPDLQVITGPEVADSLGDLCPPVDREALTGEFAEAVAADLRHSLESGIWGWHDDDLAFVRPWGFELDSMRVPLTVWQGGQDRMVPAAHGVWLAAAIPGVRAHLLPEHGHLSLAVGSVGTILDELTDA
ncbi:MAG TPA: alpha/beta fold hydrolase [Candidatus Limnocylindrales bacterium]